MSNHRNVGPNVSNEWPLWAMHTMRGYTTLHFSRVRVSTTLSCFFRHRIYMVLTTSTDGCRTNIFSVKNIFNTIVCFMYQWSASNADYRKCNYNQDLTELKDCTYSAGRNCRRTFQVKIQLLLAQIFYQSFHAIKI